MAVPFMRAYTELLVRTCHRRGAHAIGGMAAFIPSRRDAEVNALALAQGQGRQAARGRRRLRRHLGRAPRSRRRSRSSTSTPCSATRRTSSTGTATTCADAPELLDVDVADAGRDHRGGAAHERLGRLRYLAAWLGGTGAVAINNLMEDAATAEICRSQVWQWLHHGRISGVDVARIVDEVMAELGPGHDAARALFEQVATADPPGRVPHAAGVRAARPSRLSSCGGHEFVCAAIRSP